MVQMTCAALRSSPYLAGALREDAWKPVNMLTWRVKLFSARPGIHACFHSLIGASCVCRHTTSLSDACGASPLSSPPIAHTRHSSLTQHPKYLPPYRPYTG
ncbi:hypothetical protein M8818_006276 [Zalaria obscura]|uniref:Uncharacterized protein n=1 Tax=Zalaria obscura TaxID=2024903 RepID=A0ACC3S7J5_9PEZI